MIDTGGKVHLSAKGGNSALKSSVTNGERSGKSKNGRKVQFDPEDVIGALESNISRSNGKVDTPSIRGGKGEKVASATGKTATKAPTSKEQKFDQQFPSNSVCMMDCEAAEVLQGIQDQMVFLSQNPDIKLPVSFDMGLTYAKRAVNYAKPKTVKKIFEPLKKHGISDAEICLISNINPESADEVFALLPALKPKMKKLKEPLRIALGELANLKEALANLKDSNGNRSPTKE